MFEFKINKISCFLYFDISLKKKVDEKKLYKIFNSLGGMIKRCHCNFLKFNKLLCPVA